MLLGFIVKERYGKIWITVKRTVVRNEEWCYREKDCMQVIYNW
jgi:hypothetical protein